MSSIKMMCSTWNSHCFLRKFLYVQCKTCVELTSVIKRNARRLACFQNFINENNFHTRRQNHQLSWVNSYLPSNSSHCRYNRDRQISFYQRCSWCNTLPYVSLLPSDFHSIRCFHTNSLAHCFNQKQTEKSTKESKETAHISSSKKEDQKLEDVIENIYTIPNLLTCLRIAVTPYLGYLVLTGEFDLGFKIFVVAGLSDFLDGFIARNFKNQQSVLGSVIDPIADKLLVSILTVTLTIAGLLPVPLTFVIIGRDLLLICAGFYLRYITLPPPKNLKRYFDVTHATVTLLPSVLSKWNTGLQLSLIAASMAAPVFGYVDHIYLQGLWYLTGATTVASGLQYLVFRNKYIKFTQEKLKRQI
ncbi:cardiolipin synthase (CMP-forming)-like [Ylistrum balloti]|uniref:cardiolipin synthase (CMP-forming)-like n=1 Tax=Ylistrum balloti TaxID=509963 RepID=UPI00290594B5|nr:cardiolipin synthase (CMP-forming)-like [Ylistrum balloti]